MMTKTVTCAGVCGRTLPLSETTYADANSLVPVCSDCL